MIDWKFTKDERPNDGQTCFITQEQTGLGTYPILGPICYRKDDDAFMDLWSSPEAGSIYPLKEVDLWWCDEDALNLPDSSPPECTE